MYEIIKRGTEVKPLGLVSVVADDPEDDKFLDCALAANVEYVVTNDEHLLRMKTFDEVSIVKPSEFKQLLQTDKRPIKWLTFGR
ncbi:MAG: PIN domain-containing protein [Armatimonadota bacterium]